MKAKYILIFISCTGALDKIQDYYNIDDALGGLLQTVFVISYMALAPLFGYIGYEFKLAD